MSRVDEFSRLSRTVQYVVHVDYGLRHRHRSCVTSARFWGHCASCESWSSLSTRSYPLILCLSSLSSDRVILFFHAYLVFPFHTSFSSLLYTSTSFPFVFLDTPDPPSTSIKRDKLAYAVVPSLSLVPGSLPFIVSFSLRHALD